MYTHRKDESVRIRHENGHEGLFYWQYCNRIHIPELSMELNSNNTNTDTIEAFLCNKQQFSSLRVENNFCKSEKMIVWNDRKDGICRIRWLTTSGTSLRPRNCRRTVVASGYNELPTTTCPTSGITRIDEQPSSSGISVIDELSGNKLPWQRALLTCLMRLRPYERHASYNAWNNRDVNVMAFMFGMSCRYNDVNFEIGDIRHIYTSKQA